MNNRYNWKAVYNDKKIVLFFVHFIGDKPISFSSVGREIGMDVTVEDFKALKALYEKAIATDLEIVEYKGQQLNVRYLKYLIEFLQDKFKE